MNKRKLNRFKWLVRTFVVVGLLSSCATSSYKLPLTYSPQVHELLAGGGHFWPSKQFKDAFVDYWTLRYSGKLEKAYEKEAPYFQNLVPYARYRSVFMNMSKTQLLDAQVLSVEKVRDCFYQIGVNFKINSADGEVTTVYLKDEWVYVGTSWYHVIRDGILFPSAS